ncbi:hypothetical protein LCGC14_0202070 [marine sediment metagenome]
MMGLSSRFVKVWLWPIILGVLSGVGLIAALIGDGWWDFMSTLALGSAPVVCLWLGRASSNSRRKATIGAAFREAK